MMNGNKKVKQPKYEVPVWHKTIYLLKKQSLIPELAETNYTK